jgi:hypothetical protein
MIAQLLATTWEAMTLGELLGGVGLLGGGAGTVYLARGGVRALAATTRALDLWGRHLEAAAAAARAAARLAPLQAEALRAQIRQAGGKVPAEPEDSDELRVLRVVAEGDDAELAHLVEQLASADPEGTLDRKLTEAERRMVAMMREARRQRSAKPKARDADAPRRRERTPSWLERRRTAAKAQA